MKHARATGLTLLALFLVPIAASAAGLFSDVPDGHPFKGEIDSLARAGVIHGYSDGTYGPDRSVNRAEFLTLLYLATGRKPKAINVKCFVDVEVGSWYEEIVCDAAARENGFVQGYSDGKFRPGSPVSRTEALKMLFVVFGITAPELSAQNRDLIKFVDISISAWYSKYISAAYLNSILPITGQSGVRFFPDRELTRGEAAVYIFNAQRALEDQKKPQPPASSSSASSSSSSSAPAEPTSIIKNVVFPFTDSDLFQKKKPVAYLFDIKEKTTVYSHVTVTGYYTSDVSCRLYKLDADGFSYEYYLGYQSGSECTINATVKPGQYQIQIQPTVAGVPYSIEAKVGLADGNDGFADAVLLKADLAITAVLEPHDLYDWYSFSVSADTTATVEVSPTSAIQCVIYTPASIDQFGFVGPECNKPYRYQPSDEPYIIAIGRKSGDIAKKVTYTVKWK